jgi:Calcineurin-like phosphoesterase
MSLKLLHLPRSALRLGQLAALAFFLVAAASVPKVDPQAQEKLIAVGDLHGDYDAYRAILFEAALIDGEGHWSANKTILVQMGDMVDRDPKSRDIVVDLQRLQKEAPRKGGKVIVLIGNHEAMNMIGDLRYVPQAEYQNYVTPDSSALRERVYQANKVEIAAGYRQSEAKLPDAEIKAKWLEQTPLGYIEHRRAWAADGAIGKWVLMNPAVVKIRDTLFVHGGISAKYVDYSIDQLNEMVHKALLEPTTADGSILEDELGPLWYRGFLDENESIDSEVANVLKAFGVRRIVIAHTPQLTGIKVLHGGRVVDIDTGITSYYGGTHSFLSFDGSAIFAHDNGTITELKSVEEPK